jgi:hypothetical protein
MDVNHNLGTIVLKNNNTTKGNNMLYILPPDAYANIAKLDSSYKINKLSIGIACERMSAALLYQSADDVVFIDFSNEEYHMIADALKHCTTFKLVIDIPGTETPMSFLSELDSDCVILYNDIEWPLIDPNRDDLEKLMDTSGDLKVPDDVDELTEFLSVKEGPESPKDA